MIPWASPFAQYTAHRDEIEAAIAQVLGSGDYILGEEVEAFERAFAEFCGMAYAVGVGSGTDALILAMRALGIESGDEVITVSHTALATAAAVLATGAMPVLVDVDPALYTIDLARVEDAVTPRSKAIIVVHLAGQVADIEAIGAIAKIHGLRVIEDCAQAVGARQHDRRVGSLGDIGCFSFYPTKNLGAIGDGGMVVMPTAALAAKVRRLRQYGWDDNRDTEAPGLNSRLDTLQAAVLKAKLPYLDADNARRMAIAQQYTAGLSGLPLTPPAVRPGTAHVYHLYVIACDDRAGLMAHLADQKVGSAVHYPVPIHRQKGYTDRVRVPRGGLPVTDSLVGRILTLPMFPELSDSNVAHVIAAVRGFFERVH